VTSWLRSSDKPAIFLVLSGVVFPRVCAYLPAMTVIEVIQRSTDFLAKKGVDSPRLQVELLLAHHLAIPRLNLYLQFDRVLAEPELAGLRELLRRRSRREPLQHILGSTGFFSLDFKSDPRALVPRPETERLVECSLAFLAERGPTPALALDFGTGSGCIAISLAVHRPTLMVHALDCSSSALELARENAIQHGVLDRIELRQAHDLAALPADPRFDLIISNPPYIATAEIDNLSPEVKDHDPRIALDGGPDGLDFYRQIARDAPGRLASSGRLFLELGDAQGTAVSQLLHEHNWIVEAIENDYSGRPRVLRARLGDPNEP
jgi:release factor glutamine methyltransferase